MNVDSTMKINDYKNNMLKVERVQNTFENLNSLEMTLKMLKTMQIYPKCIFFFSFRCFLLFLIFFLKIYQNNGSKIWQQQCLCSFFLLFCDLSCWADIFFRLLAFILLQLLF